MNILITGAHGQLGKELMEILSLGHSEIGAVPDCYQNAKVTGVDVEQLDITDLQAVRGFFAERRFDVVFNCAAYTNVNGCESDADNAMAVNALGARNLAIAATEVGAKLAHVSTDYVFAGNADRPYTECDLPAPQSVYGRTKLAGEQFVQQFCPRSFIIRTAWLYGRHGGNFVKTMLKLAQEKPYIRVVNDQYGAPTNANDLAHHMLKIVTGESYGIYHCTGNGACTWYVFAKEIVRLAGLPCEVRPCTTEEYPTPAKRPAYSVLEHQMLRLACGDEMRDWRAALESYMRQTPFGQKGAQTK